MITVSEGRWEFAASRKMCYTWRQCRHASNHGLEALQDRSRRPRRHPGEALAIEPSSAYL